MATGGVYNANFVANAQKISFLDLPTEIVAKVFEELKSKDRKSLANANSRLNEIEKKAGCRRFGVICYEPRPVHFNNFDYGILPNCIYPEDLKNSELYYLSLATFFNRAIAGDLRITVWVNWMKSYKGKLLVVLMTVNFENVNIHFTSECNGRFIFELLRNRKFIEGEVNIRFSDTFSNGKAVLMGLPYAHKYNIDNRNAPMIDDEILLHLVNNSNSTHIKENNRITAYGLIAAFKMVCSSNKPKYVLFVTYRTVFDDFVRQLDPKSFHSYMIGDQSRILHRKSSAIVFFDGNCLRMTTA